MKNNRNKFERDFALFENNRKQSVRNKLKAKKTQTFGNWKVNDSYHLNNLKISNEKKAKLLSVSQLDDKRLNDLFKARQLRRRYNIYVFPETETTPLPIFTFKELISPMTENKNENKNNETTMRKLNQLLINLKDWGMQRLLPVQMQVIPMILSNHEIQCCAPTGSGKTLAFVIPILILLIKTLTIQSNRNNSTNSNSNCNGNETTKTTTTGLKCLIVAPTVVLCNQIYKEFLKYSKNLGISVSLIDKFEKANTNTNTSTASNIVVSMPKVLKQCVTKNIMSFDELSFLIALHYPCAKAKFFFF